MVFCVYFSVYPHSPLCLYSCYSTGWSVPVKYRTSFFVRVCLISLLSDVSSVFRLCMEVDTCSMSIRLDKDYMSTDMGDVKLD